MSNALADGSHVDNGGELIRRAAEQALDLRQTVNELVDPQLRELVDVVLIELGFRLSKLK
ncbi:MULTISPECIES: hypothetical protein [unclassified Methylobacterium]|jgi:hypothetical protein|uniref:hypothetical protein n=1 Tax=unclassified Methylobacterium TaxID=2615210 RepID=UPI0010D4D69D|nr:MULTISPECIES: hypothetical protein [unclassified Methylobacterium]QEE40393.1 hypothetical protein FVA80_16810 [Methylobacterium sp. WL1]RYF09177.1 MAG: hypothetical protein EOO77_24450 [Oxalobacteraceae bacterium]TXN01695.1 hypothetical protein FV242_17610 [Methylobacterium sp. WL64]TXN55770.1 hypothetical protein FV241_18490 [Methylobacterium sp. WL2]